MRWTVGLLLALGVVRASFGQESGADDQPSTSAPQAIDIDVESFGVGNIARSGEWAGVRLTLQDNASGAQPRAVVVRWHIPDPDGDVLLAQRSVTLTPGRRLGVWLYAPLPWSQPALYTVTVHELLDTGAIDGGVGRQLAADRIRPTRVLEPDFAMIGVVGSEIMALDQYELPSLGEWRKNAHEWIDVVTNIVPEQMPDMWAGLLQYETIVWGNADPTRLGPERTAAMIEWVRRGGHLVVVMPSVGGVWFTRDDPFASIMPEVNVVRVEDADYEPYRRLLTSEEFDDTPLPSAGVVHSFERAQDVDPMDAAPLIDGPHGVVVTRRLSGVGMVTVVGLDLTDPTIRSRRVLRADAFWHRILGKRLPVPVEPPKRPVGGAEEQLDRHFAGSIENTAQAGVGILLAVVVFAAYWLVAGPLGFGLLKAKHWHRHAWVAFGLSTAVFAFIAWAGANTLADREVRARHLTFLDHVYGESTQRTRTFAGVMVPGYGDRTLGVRDGSLDAGYENLVSVWTDAEGGVITTRFPDARSYDYAVRDPSSLRSPVRSTVKSLRAEWVGGVRWQTPRPVDASQEPRITGVNRLTGALIHDLPGPLRNAKITLCYGQAEATTVVIPDTQDAYQGRGYLYPRMWQWELMAEWKPGERIDLAGITGKVGNPGQTFLEKLVPNDTGSGFGPPNVSFSSGQARDDAERLTWLPLLHQPNFTTTSFQKKRVASRAGHGLDIARFATMPCIIVTGHLYTDEPSEDGGPTPLTIGSGDEPDAVPMQGHTVVRWIYPLTPAPVRYDAR